MISKIINGVKYWGQLILLPVYWLSFLMPRNKKIWLFGSTFGRRFADNPRYLYLYVSQHKEELGIRPIWISHNHEIVSFLNENGYEAYDYHSLKGIWFALRGKVYLFDNYSKDINFWQSGRAIKVNMWHGIPLKKIQADNIFDKVRHPQNARECFKSFPRRLSDEKANHYVLTTSDFLVDIFSSAFRTKNVLTSGYSRNDRLIADEIKNLHTPLEQKNVDKIKSAVGKENKMVYYMPTFRDSEKKFFEVVDLKQFQEFLKKNHIIFCTKLHPKSKLKKEFDLINGENLIVIDANTDPYVFLEMTDVLVTDYSSIYFDFLLADKPIVFFDYDLREYLSESREMYFDYEAFTPGEKADTLEKLENALLKACGFKEAEITYEEMRNEIREKVFNYSKSTACPRLVDDIKNIINYK